MNSARHVAARAAVYPGHRSINPCRPLPSKLDAPEGHWACALAKFRIRQKPAPSRAIAVARWATAAVRVRARCIRTKAILKHRLWATPRQIHHGTLSPDRRNITHPPPVRGQRVLARKFPAPHWTFCRVRWLGLCTDACANVPAPVMSRVRQRPARRCHCIAATLSGGKADQQGQASPSLASHGQPRAAVMHRPQPLSGVASRPGKAGSTDLPVIGQPARRGRATPAGANPRAACQRCIAPSLGHCGQALHRSAASGAS